MNEPAAQPSSLFVFVPSPNDNYSPETGSANISRLYEISRRHISESGKALFVIGKDARFDYLTGECVRVEFLTWLTVRQRWRDLVCGWLGKPRTFRAARYLDAARALPEKFAGPIFLYNDAAALAPFRARCPRALLCFYCGNLIWKTFGRSEIRAMLSLADVVVCISDFLANDLRKRLRRACSALEYSRLESKIAVIPNGVDLEMFRPARANKTASESEKPKNSPPVILFVGRIQPVKGAHVLIAAARKIQRSGRDFQVRIVGSRAFSADAPLTPYQEKLRELAAPLGEKIQFQPFVNRARVAEEYRNADIFCMPSVWAEPFGMTLLESMASGLPTVASKRGGIPEAGGDAIQYFQPRNINQLTQILNGLLDDETARREWGNRARRRAEEFSWDRHYRELVRVIARAQNAKTCRSFCE